MNDAAKLLIEKIFRTHELKNLLSDSNLPINGVKGDLIDRVVENLNLPPEGLLPYLDKDAVQNLLQKLSEKSSGSVADLRKRAAHLLETKPQAILEALSKKTIELSVEFIFDKYYDAESLKDFLYARSIPISGTKAELIDRAIRKVKPTLKEALMPLQKDQLVHLAEELQIDIKGKVKSDLIAGIAGTDSDTVEAPGKEQIASPAQIRSSQKVERSADFKKVHTWLSQYQLKKPEKSEAIIEKELDIVASHIFGSTKVRTQVNVQDARIDLEICKIGIELKVPKNDNELEIMLKNLRKYQKHYGENLILVVYTGYVKRDVLHGYLEQVKEMGIDTITK